MTARDPYGRFTRNPLPSSIISARRHVIKTELTDYIRSTPREKRRTEMDWRMPKGWRLLRVLSAFMGGKHG